MPKSSEIYLSRRERQVMDIIYRLGEASVADVLDHLPDPPGYNSIRAILKILEDKGRLTHRKESQKFIYIPTVQPDKAKRSAMAHLVHTFFEGSAPQAVSTLLDMSAENLSDKELQTLSEMIEKAKAERKK